MKRPEVFNAWAQFGAEHFVTKVRSGWLVEVAGFRVQKVFKTKREAMEVADELAPNVGRNGLD